MRVKEQISKPRTSYSTHYLFMQIYLYRLPHCSCKFYKRNVYFYIFYKMQWIISKRLQLLILVMAEILKVPELPTLSESPQIKITFRIWNPTLCKFEKSTNSVGFICALRVEYTPPQFCWQEENYLFARIQLLYTVCIHTAVLQDSILWPFICNQTRLLRTLLQRAF